MKNTVYTYSIIQELKKDISDFVAFKERCHFGCDGERAGTFCRLGSWVWNDRELYNHRPAVGHVRSDISIERRYRSLEAH